MQIPSKLMNPAPGFCASIPECFKSLEEARNSLDYQWNLCNQKAVDFEHLDTTLSGTEQINHREEYDTLRRHYKIVFRNWSNAFKALLGDRSAHWDAPALQASRVLQIEARVAGMFLGISAFTILHDQMFWDDLMPTFKEILDLAAPVIEALKAADRRNRKKPVFHMDQAVIGALFTVAHKCRDPFLRRRAIALLYSTPIQEGVWNSILSARVAERIVSLEEEGLDEVRCAADVPDRMRISDMMVKFDHLVKRGYITFLRLQTSDSDVREPVSDTFEW